MAATLDGGPVQTDAASLPPPAAPIRAAGRAPGGLLAALREGTRAAHDRLDARAAALDVRTRPGLAALLAMNEAVFAAMAAAAPADGPAARMLPPMLEALRADLGALGAPRVRIAPLSALDGAVADYLVVGSRLGSRVLHRRWLGAADPAVKAAGRYLGASERAGDPADGWPALTARLAALEGQGPAARTRVAQARGLFARFEAALDAAVAAGPSR